MGFDISLWVEYKDTNGKWKDVKDYDKIRCEKCKGLGQIYYDQVYYENSKKMYGCNDCLGKGHRDALSYKNRCYPIFAILADVKNTFDITPISDECGMPEDYKEDEGYEEYLKEIEKAPRRWYPVRTGTLFDADSYHTLKQLKDYDWATTEKIIPWIKDEQFYRDLIPALQRLADKHGGDDNVRIVFFFDY
jgi:hypothetical protein